MSERTLAETMVGAGGGAQPAAAQRAQHRGADALRTLRRRWWVVAGGAAALAGSLLAPVHGAGPLAPAYSEGLLCNSQAGTTTPSFVVTARDGYILTPDGNSIYMWGYALGNGAFQYPGPNICVNQGDVVTVTLRNTLPAPTSILFNGITQVSADGARANPDPASGSLTKGAGPGGSVTYRFTAVNAGTFLYESGTNPTIQDQMGLIGALIVRPAGHPDYVYNDVGTTVDVPKTIASGTTYPAYDTVGANTVVTVPPPSPPATGWQTNQWAGHTAVAGGRVGTVKSNTANTLTLDSSASAVVNTSSGWSPAGNPTVGTPLTILALDTRFGTQPGDTSIASEYMHMLSEVDPDLHQAIERLAQSPAPQQKTYTYDMRAYHARYFMINGRTFPDTVAPNNSQQLPAQPYGSLVHILPRSAANPLPAVVRYLNAGPQDYPFHPHVNQEKIVGIDGHEQVNPSAAPGGNPADISTDHFGIIVAPGQTKEGMFSWIDAQSWNHDTNPIQVPAPGQSDRFEGPYWNGSPYLGDRQPFADGVERYNQCGEFYNVAHSHALDQLTNFGFSGGGMLTMVRIDPPKGGGADAGTQRSDCLVTGG